MIEAKAKLKNVRISPKKMRLVADAIRGLDVVPALARLQVTFKRSAPVIDKLLKSAVANAIDRYEVKEDDLIVKSILVDKALDLKRWRPAAFGRAHPFRKHASHVEIIVVAKEGVKAVAKDKKKEPIDTVDLTKSDKKPSEKKAIDKSSQDSSKARSTAKQTGAKRVDNMKVKKG